MSAASGWSRRGLLAGGLALTAAPALGKASADITAPAGRFLGTVEDGVLAFRGIRYGRAARFQAPVAERNGRDPVIARAFGPVAPQAGGHYQPQAEDCLFLNIWTTDAHPAAKKPVMVYFHGGAYSAGSSTDPLNEGGRLAASGDVVVVTVNHRLNALGYLYLARLDPRLADSGNAGQLDLILALQWVRDNIATFGGDARNVMLFGQSGGGAKIATLMGMPAAKGLFHRAATMSGQQVTASGPLNATARTRAYLAKLGVDAADLSPLLAMPVERLMDGLAAADPVLGGSVYFGPVLDMKWLSRHPFWPDANPQSNAIPMLLGNTRDEARAFLPPGSPKLAGLDWGNLANRMAPELRVDISPEWVVAQFRARYPAMTPHQLLWAAVTAGRSWRGQVIEAELRAAADAPTWVYQCDFVDPARPQQGAPHTMDIALVFGTTAHGSSLSGDSPAARAASAAMMRAFAGFARTGRADWPQYRTDTRATMIFDAVSRIENDPRRWERELFARVPYVQPGT